MATFGLHVYVDRSGNWCGSSVRTDEMVSIGFWDLSQLSYRPFIWALNDGVDDARCPRPQRRLEKYSAAQFAALPVGMDVPRPGKRINPKTVEAMRLHLVDGIPVSEAARRLGWHRANVQRAIIALRNRLEAI